MSKDALLVLGCIETAGTLTGLSTGECELPSSTLDASATGGSHVASNDRSAAILSAWYGQ